ncbi:MAG: substrate-binding domain-containing protein, partial [Phyllobacterium sp.]
MKKLLALFALTLALSGPALAEGPVDTSKVNKEYVTAADGKTYTIATVVKVDGIAWFDRMREGVDQFKSETGADVWMVGPSSADAAAQVQIVENLIAQGVDAICIVPFSVEAVEPVLK